jgi:hypothetical protein
MLETQLITRTRIREFVAFRALKPRQKRLLNTLLTTNLKIEPAAIKMGIEPKTHYNWLENPDYLQAFNFVKQVYGDYLEADMAEDALSGQEKPIIFKGKITGYYREKNTREREILLKGLKPGYRDSYTPAGSAAPITLSITYPGAPTASIDITPTTTNSIPPPDDDV